MSSSDALILLLPLIFPNIRDFSSESSVRISLHLTKAAEEPATPIHQIHGITNKVDQLDVLGDVKILKNFC